MKLRRILIQVTCRIIFGTGIAALLWVGANLVYAKAFQLYALSSFGSKLQSQTELSDIGSTPSQNLRNGDLVGRLHIPGAGLSVAVLEGIEDSTLGIAAGHIPGTSLPGANGNVAIAAHRDSYFRALRDIEVGDTIEFATRKGTFRYFVTTTEVVAPSEIRVLASHGHAELTLITCYPFSFLGTAPQRFIVHAQLQNESGPL